VKISDSEKYRDYKTKKYIFRHETSYVVVEQCRNFFVHWYRICFKIKSWQNYSNCL